MLPVVPKVRVGDVLFGTRHLRQWIHASSQNSYIESIYQGVPDLGRKIISPSKDCQFIVAANSGRHFLTWSPFENLAILFVNSGKGSERMRPDLFAHWFIRTPGRHAQLAAWPEWAFGMWAFLQMGLCMHKDFRMHLPQTAQLPFDLHRMVTKPYPRVQALAAILNVAAQGLLRGRSNPPTVWPYSYGPRPEDAAMFQRNTEDMSRHPRVIAFLRKNQKPGGQPTA